MQELLIIGNKSGPAAVNTAMLLQADASQVPPGLPVDRAKPGRVFTKYATPGGVVTAQAKFGQYSFDCRTGGFEVTGQQKKNRPCFFFGWCAIYGRVLGLQYGS